MCALSSWTTPSSSVHLAARSSLDSRYSCAMRWAMPSCSSAARQGGHVVRRSRELAHARLAVGTSRGSATFPRQLHSWRPSSMVCVLQPQAPAAHLLLVLLLLHRRLLAHGTQLGGRLLKQGQGEQAGPAGQGQQRTGCGLKQGTAASEDPAICRMPLAQQFKRPRRTSAAARCASSLLASRVCSACGR